MTSQAALRRPKPSAQRNSGTGASTVNDLGAYRSRINALAQRIRGTNDVSAIMPFFFGGSTDDMSQDPEVKAALIEGGTSNDPAVRQAAYTKAIKLITSKAYMLPIATFTTTYGVSRQLNFKTWADEMPRFYLSTWK